MTWLLDERVVAPIPPGSLTVPSRFTVRSSSHVLRIFGIQTIQRTKKQHEMKNRFEMTTKKVVPRVRWMRSWSRTVGYYRYNSSSSSCGPQRNVVVALSGGVDSSVAAALLLSDNHNLQYNVSAIHMSNWSFRDEDPSSDSSSFEKASKRISACSSDADWEHARKIANALTLPIRRLSLESDYWIRVFEPYVQAIAERGVMPNPDLSCNRHIKFGALLEHVLQTHGEQALLATGHYARLWKPNHHHGSLSSSKLNYQIPDWLQTWSRSPILLAGVDESKDQSYFLASCQPQAFQHVIFPLGDYYKSKRQLPKKNPQDDAPCSFSSDASMPILEPSLPPQPTVREMAATWNLPSATQRESMGICFIGKRQSFAEFMAAYMPLATRRIRFVDVDTGTVIHESQECAHPVFYTPGQGARIGGCPIKYFVVDNGASSSSCDDPYHTVHVCAGTHHPALFSDTLFAGPIHWLSDPQTPPPPPLWHSSSTLRCQCRVRHLQPLVGCTITIASSPSLSQDFITRVDFDLPVRGITPGQTVVFYHGIVCLGSAVIKRAGETYFERNQALPLSLHPAGANDLSTIRRIEKYLEL